MKRFVLLLFLISNVIASAQVTITPAFPTITDSITITFNAEQGDAGLKDFTGDVYAHTGLITSTSNEWQYVPVNWGVADDKVKLTRVSTNLYELKMVIKDFYNVPDGVVVTQIAFVFRNAGGSVTGRATGGADIFAPIFEASDDFLVNLEAPTEKIVAATLGANVPFTVQSTKQAAFTVKEDGQTVFTATGTTLDSFVVAQGGFHEISIEVTYNEITDTVSFTYLVIEPDAVQDSIAPRPGEAGIFYTSDSSVLLQFYAPFKQTVHLIGDFNDWKPSTEMYRTPDSTIFWYHLTGLEAGELYGFQYLVDGELVVADPYSTMILDPFNDPSIPASVYPDLPQYPTGKTTQLVGVLSPGKIAYNWQVDFQKPAQKELVIYEMLMRDFFDVPSFEKLKDTISYFKRLGVNAIQLMPLNEFEGNDSWGYNPSFHNALDKYYGPETAFKAFVDEAHANGMAVIMDVVYNHAFGQSTLSRLYWDKENNRPAANSPYANPVARHPFNVGFDLNHESEPVRDYVKATLIHWMQEYNLDGFRFDLSKGFSQRSTTDVGFWSSYDQGRIDILKEYYDTLRTVSDDAYLILEHFGDVTEERELSAYGFMLWNNLNHAFSNLAKGVTANLVGIDPKERGMDAFNLVSYMESHDEERQMVRVLNEGQSNSSYNTRQLSTALSRAEMASVLFYTFPGPKMLWQFGEFGYDLSINRCTDGSINDNCRLSIKPTRWEYLENNDRKRLFDLNAAMLKLRSKHAVFHTDSITYSLDTEGKSITLFNDTITVIAVANPALETKLVPISFPQEGTWYRYFENDSLQIGSNAQGTTLPAGGYEIFSSKRLRQANEIIFTNTDELRGYLNNLTYYPNPVTESLWVEIDLQKPLNIEIQLKSILGQTLATKRISGTAGNHSLTFDVSTLPAGMYLLHLVSAKGQVTQRILK